VYEELPCNQPRGAHTAPSLTAFNARARPATLRPPGTAAGEAVHSAGVAGHRSVTDADGGIHDSRDCIRWPLSGPRRLACVREHKGSGTATSSEGAQDLMVLRRSQPPLGLVGCQRAYAPAVMGHPCRGGALLTAAMRMKHAGDPYRLMMCRGCGRTADTRDRWELYVNPESLPVGLPKGVRMPWTEQ
jgi:hypothetical protein